MKFLYVLSLSVLIMALLTFSAGAKEKKVDCNIQKGPCTKTIQDVEISFEIRPRPVKAMTELTFILKVTGRQPKSNPYIDLSMPGMDMGKNRVDVRSVDTGAFEGKGIIVKCPSGKKIWRAKVILPGIGQTEFTFRVIH